MAILQISQMQVRRGLNQDLPQLASGELGWSLDTRQLYIGNGTIAEGAPSLGVTEILTQYSNFANFVGSYTFKGLLGGTQINTGVNSLNPVLRTLQDKLDDFVDVRDFGAVGNGVADDTAAINRAIKNLYSAGIGLDKRAIYIPAGVYLISGPILLPPGATIRGDGKANTIINIGATAAYAAMTTCDSAYQYGNSIGSTGGTLPNFVTVSDLTIQSSNASTYPLIVNSATDVIFERIQYIGGTYSVSVAGASSVVKLYNSTFTGYSTAPLLIGATVTGVVTRNDHLDTTQVTLNTGTTTLTTLANGGGYIDYQVQDNSNNYRFGKLNYSVSNGVCSFNDNYNEPALSLNANLWANSTGTLSFTVTNTSTLKYNIKTFT